MSDFRAELEELVDERVMNRLIELREIPLFVNGNDSLVRPEVLQVVADDVVREVILNQELSVLHE